MDIPRCKSLTVEFKRDQKLSDQQIFDEVVALANTRGGTLYIGVEDDGTPTGSHGRDPLRLEAKIAANTVPPLQVRAETLVVDDPVQPGEQSTLEIVAIEVSRSQDIVATAQGKASWRLLDTKGRPITRPLYPYQMPHRLSDLTRLDISAQPMQETTFEDLDPLEIQRLRDTIERYGRADKSLLELDTKELLSALGLVISAEHGQIPTLAGLLMLGTREARCRFVPAARIVFQVLDGTQVARDEELSGSLVASMERLMELLELYNPAKERQSGAFSRRVPAFSTNALREAFVNAIGHRDYSLPGNVRILVNEEGITVSNPGGFVMGITTKNLITVAPQGRNPLLMDALKRVGLAERTGRGVDRIYEGSLRYGRDLPSYEASTNDMVQLLIPRGEPDWLFIDILDAGKDATGVALSLASLIAFFGLWREAAEGLPNDGTIRFVERWVKFDQARLDAAERQLEQLGYIRILRSGGARRIEIDWTTISRWLGRTVKRIPGTLAGDANVDEAMILSLAKGKGAVTVASVTDAFGCSRNQAAYLIRKLVAKGQLIKTGNGRATTYRLPNQ